MRSLPAKEGKAKARSQKQGHPIWYMVYGIEYMICKRMWYIESRETHAIAWNAILKRKTDWDLQDLNAEQGPVGVTERLQDALFPKLRDAELNEGSYSNISISHLVASP